MSEWTIRWRTFPPRRALRRRARDLIFRCQGTRRMLFIAGLIISITGVPLAWFFCADLPADLILAAASRRSEGRVVAASTRGGKKGRPSTEIRFRYLNGDGAEREATCYTFDPALRISATVGAQLPIEVSGPWARIDGATRSQFGYGGAAVLVNPLTGAILLWWAARGRRRAIFAFIHGRPVLARVTFAGENKHVHSGNKHPFVVRWEFTVAGAQYRGAVSSMERAMMEELLSKTEVVVLYDALNPSTNSVFIS